jgi:hypothetical protein
MPGGNAHTGTEIVRDAYLLLRYLRDKGRAQAEDDEQAGRQSYGTHDALLILRRLREKLFLAPAGKSRSGGPRPRMTVAGANRKAMELAKKMKREFFALSEREQAKLIGCHWLTWRKTPFYQEAKKKAPRRKRASGKPAVSLTDTLEAITAQGEKDEVLHQVARREEQQEAERQEQLQRLIAEQKADQQAHEGRRFRPRKRP